MAFKKKQAVTSESFAPKEAPAPEEGMGPPDEEAMERAKGDLESLMHAEEIRKDDKRMHAVHHHAKAKMASIKSISDLRNVYDAKYGEKKKKK